jgi:hypothetical protein
VLIPPAEAAACNVLQLTALPAGPLPPNWPAAAAAAGGALSASLQLHLPAPTPPAAPAVAAPVRCAGASGSGGRLVWPAAQQSVRVHLPAAANAALKAAMELGRPLTLEVARYCAAEGLADPAFGAYHALLQLDAAPEQLQEPGAVAAAGQARALGCMSWALQQGKVAAACLPPYSTPPG